MVMAMNQIMEYTKYARSGKDKRGIFKEIAAKDELKDYSGPFKSDLRFSDFSKEQLVKMYEMANDYYISTVLAYNVIIAQKYGVDALYEIMGYVWPKWLGPELKRIHGTGLNIPCNDIDSIMKILQVILDWGTATADNTYEMPSKDRGIITCHGCLATSLHEEGLIDEAMLKMYCQLDTDCNEAWANLFNPDIVFKPLSLSPRKSKSDPACKWELTYKK